MAKGVHELKMKLFKSFSENDTEATSFGSGNEVEERYLRSQEFADLSDLHSFLDACYMSRIGIRMLMSQHIALLNKRKDGLDAFVKVRPPPKLRLQQLIQLATCVYDNMEMRQKSNCTTIPTFPCLLCQVICIILFEVIKNSMRAVVEFHGVDNDMSPIKIVIADGDDNEDVSIKISDEGGGIPRSSVSRIWSYLYTTADSKAFERLGASNLAGLGYGLPISRLFARFFGGDLQVISMEGYGTDAYLHLKRVGDASEPLP
ncbi:hypothetical protein PsorP6_000165 [Peronosclerospora sorghi]|uniref:Uncharacterized protein n=1 Tax=Peronosclerospora sorghi TaxID=230839 RepID=A0ACC0WXR5_9STRA|nr:hypothetical protein PsorP6_000165 [Peronosclerospora sorghi]